MVSWAPEQWCPGHQSNGVLDTRAMVSWAPEQWCPGHLKELKLHFANTALALTNHSAVQNSNVITPTQLFNLKYHDRL